MKFKGALAAFLLLACSTAYALLGVGLPVSNAAFGIASSSAPPGAFGVSAGSGANNNKFISTLTGSVVQLVGVNASGLEINQNSSDWTAYANSTLAFWQSVRNYVIPAGTGSLPQANAGQAAGFNVVRLALNSAYWLGYACGQSTTTYQADVANVVNQVTAAGMYIDLDLHWDAPTAFGCPRGQENMESDNATTFWTQVATIYGSNPAVIFDLFNEPIGMNTGSPPSSPDEACLLSGCNYNPFIYQDNVGGTNNMVTVNITFHSPGMQALVNAIRGTGAINMILVAPLVWAGDISSWVTTYSGISDPLHNVAATVHVYGYASGTGPPLGVNSAGFPLFITETFGFNSSMNGSNTSQTTGYALAQSNNWGYLCWGVINSWSGASTLSLTSTPPLGVSSTAGCPNWVP